MLKNSEQILKLKSYVADCELVHFSVERKNINSSLSAEGCATLVCGDIELEFNWLAEGRVSSAGEFIFKVSLDEAEPDFYLIGIDECEAEAVDELCKKILASCNWQAEVEECLPTKEADLASI